VERFINHIKRMPEGIHNTTQHKRWKFTLSTWVAAPHSPTPTLLTAIVQPPASGIRTPSHGRALLCATYHAPAWSSPWSQAERGYHSVEDHVVPVLQMHQKTRVIFIHMSLRWVEGATREVRNSIKSESTYGTQVGLPQCCSAQVQTWWATT
jgi:hypothetical protein